MFIEWSKEQIAAFIVSCVTLYNRITAAAAVWLVVNMNGVLYAIEFEHMPIDFVKITRTSGAHGEVEYKTRVKPNGKQVEKAMQEHSVVRLGGYDELKAAAIAQLKAIGKTDNGINDGWIAEYGVYSYAGKSKEWKRDSIPFYERGDIEINGRQIQIKHIGAEFMRKSAYDRLTEMFPE